MGLQRALHESATGRAFLQTHGPDLDFCPDFSHYFHTLKSARRLQLLQEVNQLFARCLKEGLPDELAVFPQLDNFDLYAGDGHWHQAASHDPIIDEKTYATGHFYVMDLRRRTLRRLTTAQGKKEHDMHALKRLTKQMLRQGAPVGRQVLYVWDKAAIDFPFWHHLKTTAGIYFISLEKENMALEVMGKKEQDIHALKRLTKQRLRQGAPVGRQVLYVWDKAVIDFHFWHRLKTIAGIYFLSLEKENMALEVMGNKEWDPADPINHGVLQDELVGSSNGVLLRRVTCQAPDTGEIRVFLTTEMTLPPGLIAHLYHRRWRIEKVFDCLKNKLNEKKSWATSPAGKAAQAEFLCLTHNLIRRVEEELARQEGVTNEPDYQRRRDRFAQQKSATEKAGRLWPSTWDTLHKPVQYSVKLIRWLRSGIQSGLTWTAALPRLRALYATL